MSTIKLMIRSSNTNNKILEEPRLDAWAEKEQFTSTNLKTGSDSTSLEVHRNIISPYVKGNW